MSPLLEPAEATSSCGVGPARPAVLLLVNNLDLAGAQMVVVRLATHLAEFGWHPVVCAWKRGGPLEESLRARGIEVSVPAAPRDGFRRLLALTAVSRLARGPAVRVIHAHMSDAAVLGVIAGQLSGKPCVVTHHNEDLLDTTGVGRPAYRAVRGALFRMAVQHAMAHVAVSASVARMLASETRVESAVVSVIQNGVPLVSPDERARVAAARSRRCADSGRRTILSIGRLVPAKGQRALIRALPFVATQLPGVEAVVLGEGPDREDLVALAQGLGVAERVHLPGTDIDTSRWFGRADVFVSTSLVEGAPLVVLEAMMWGVPVVLSDHRVHRELCGDGRRGVLFPAEDATALAQAILLAAGDPVGAESRAAAAARYVSSEHGIPAMARRYSELYAAVARAHGAKVR